ncbi:MAG: PhnD/SsuA/transferrin family substrate-binding protein [Roseburia sp.]
MKKLISLMLTLAFSVSVLAGCGADGPGEPAGSSSSESVMTEKASTEVQTTEASPSVDIKIAALKGPTAMGMVQFMSEAEAGTLTDHNYQFSIVASPDEVTPLLVQGKLDIAAVPANLASVLYNNTAGEIQVLAINTLGVLYIVESGDSVSSVADLKGKTIYASGKGATPEYALNYMLAQNGIDPKTDVSIEWKSEHTECLSALMAEENAIAMLPQPFVTTAQTKSEKIRVALDMTEEWNRLQDGNDHPSALITGVVVGRKAFAEENPEAVSAFLTHYEASVQYVNENTADAAELVGAYGIVDSEIAKEALPYCNITFIEGTEMKEKLSGYLDVLFRQNEKAVGGTIPGDDFYYSRG